MVGDRLHLGGAGRLPPADQDREPRLDACSRTACGCSRCAGRRGGGDHPLPRDRAAGPHPASRRGRRPADAAVGAGVQPHPVPLRRVRRRRGRAGGEGHRCQAGRHRAQQAAAGDQRQGRARRRRPSRAGIVDLEDFDSTLYFLDETRSAVITQRGRAGVPAGPARQRRSPSCSTSSSSRARTGPGARSSAILETLPAPPPQRRATSGRSPSILRETRSLVQQAPGTFTLDAAGAARRLRGEAERARRSLRAAAAVARRGARRRRARRTSSELFRELRPSALETVLTWLPNARRRPRARAARVGRRPARRDQSRTKCCGCCASPNPRRCRRSIELCGRLKLQAAVPGLGETVRPRRSGGPPRRGAGARRDRRRPARSARSSAAIDDADREVRLAAVQAMGRAGIQGRAAPDRAGGAGQGCRRTSTSPSGWRSSRPTR